MKRFRLSIFLPLVFFIFQVSLLHGGIEIIHLRTNYQITPLGIDTEIPQFSWQMQADDQRRGYQQVAFQLLVTDERKSLVWNSGRINSGLSHAIQYTGKSLKPRTRYEWTVTVWTNFNQQAKASSWFETGLMDPREAAWTGAQWIGSRAEDINFYSHYLSVYKINYSLQLDEASGSTRAAFLFGANDRRLMQKHLNLQGMANGHNKSFIAVELDISTLSADSASRAMLRIYRVGYAPQDRAQVPFKSLRIPRHLIHPENRYSVHDLVITCNFGIFEFYIGGSEAKHKISDASMEPASRFATRGLNLNPVGAGNNFISFPMVADLGFRTGLGQQAHFSGIHIKHFRYPSNDIFNDQINPDFSQKITRHSAVTFSQGRYTVPPFTVVTADPSHDAAPMLRTSFSLASKAVRKARLYITARGIYEASLNGQRIGQDYFNPGLTQYNRHHLYQTYDVTSQLRPGKNVLGAWLGEGWWSGNITYSGENWNYFGDRQSLLAKLVITYADGSEEVVVSRPDSWKVYTEGPLRVGSFFQGEVYDATLEDDIKDWNTADYTDASWSSAQVVPLEGTAYQGTFTDVFGRRSTFDFHDFQLVGQPDAPARVIDTLSAVQFKEVRPGVYVYDLGQNLVGQPRLHIRQGQAGRHLSMRYAEVLYPELPAYQGQEGMMMMENIRAALAQDEYTLAGGDEIIVPRFTFHGYRYLEITGLDSPLALSDVQALVISSVHQLASHYETSHPLVNKLWENITWSLKGNFLSIPTDCPNRNERMGWSGDISVFARSANYLADANQFLRRHLLAMRDLQTPEGRFPDVAPVGGGFGGTLWGSAGITVAWETYRQSGDEQLLREHYQAMKKYLSFLESKVDPNSGILNEGPLGDWLSPEGNKNDNTLFWMAYFAYDLDLVSRVATILGYTTDAQAYRQRSDAVKTLFNEIYVDKVTHRTVRSGMRTGFMGPPGQQAGAVKSDQGVEINTQASYAIPLALGVFNSVHEPYAIQHLKEAIIRRNIDDGGTERPEYSLMTGFIGTAAISSALCERGLDDLAYRLLMQEEYPSWLYSVVNGATTIWERLNSFTVENGFGGNNSMNSFNHYSFGAIAAWMYEYSLGIQRDPHQPAFKSFILRPMPDPNGTMTSAGGFVESVYGPIRSAWRRDGQKVIYTVEVPPNTAAVLQLRAAEINKIKEKGGSIKTWKGITHKQDLIHIPLGSGRYIFEVTP